MRMSVHSLEVARGHDGFLRGDPEPVVIAALYAAIPGEMSLVGRALSRFDAPRPFPREAFPIKRRNLAAQIGRTDVQFIALVLGELAFWTYDATDPTPTPLVRLIDSACEHDKWIGCCVWTASPRSGREALRYRAHLLSSNEKNDWTAVVEMVL